MKRILVLSAVLFLSCAALNAQGLDASAASLSYHYLNNAALKTGMNSLNKRLGDLRRVPQDSNYAFWARGFYADYSYSGDYDIDAKFSGIEGGLDFSLLKNGGDRLFAGLTGGYMQAGNAKAGGISAVKAYAPSAGLYLTWLGRNGWFADFTARNFFYTTEDLNAPFTKTGWNTAAASLELGREFKFVIDDYSFFKLEPKVKGVYGRISGETINFGGGSALKYAPQDIILARAGIFAGYSKTLNNCAVLEPYLEAGYNRNFSPDAEIEDNNGARARQKLSGGSFDAGGGVNIIVTNIISLYSYAGYEKGSGIKNFSANAGVRIAIPNAKRGKVCCTPQKAEPVQAAPAAQPAPVMPLAPAEAAQMRLAIVHFAFDKSIITPADGRSLETLAGEIEKSGSRIEIRGYTDRVGPPQYNQALSERRAKAVYDRLAGLGVAREQMDYKGFGFSNPVNDAKTKAADAENRRVEFVIKQ